MGRSALSRGPRVMHVPAIGADEAPTWFGRSPGARLTGPWVAAVRMDGNGYDAPTGGTSHMKEGVVARKFLRAFAEWDLDTYESLLAPGAVEGRPQMGERFVGRERIMGMYRSRTGEPPRIEWRQVQGEGQIWIGQGVIEDAAGAHGPDHIVALVKLDAGSVIAVDYYFSSCARAAGLPPALRHRRRPLARLSA